MGNLFPTFETLDVKIASSLKKIIPNSHFRKRVYLEEQKALKDDRFLRGRHIAFLICEHFRVLFSITLICSVYRHMATTFKVLIPDGKKLSLSIHQVPSDDTLESLSKMRRIRGSDQLKTVLALFEQKNSQPSYLKKTAKGKPVSADRTQGGCCQCKAKGQCTKGDACSFSDVENKRGKSTRSSSPAPESQTKSDGEKSLKGKSLSEAAVRLGRDLEDRGKTASVGTCTNSSCDSSGKKVLFLKHREAESQPNKRPKRMVEKVLLPY